MDVAYVSGKIVTIQEFHASDVLCNIMPPKKPQGRMESIDMQEGLHNHGGFLEEHRTLCTFI